MPGPRLRSAAEYGFRVVSEQQLYNRWLALYNRTITFPAHGSVPVRHRWDPPDHLCSVASIDLSHHLECVVQPGSPPLAHVAASDVFVKVSHDS